MKENYLSNWSHAQPMLDSAQAVGDSVVHNAMRVKRMVVALLKTIAKCWAFFKDIHFSFFTIVPVISHFTSLTLFQSLILWGICFFPILIVITFWAVDSLFDLRTSDSLPQTLRSPGARREEPPSIIASPAGATKYRAHSTGFTPLQSRMHMTPARRHRALRPLRSRKPGFW